VDEIENAVRQVRRVGVAVPEFDVRRRSRARVFKKRHILIEPDHTAVWANAPRQRFGKANGTLTFYPHCRCLTS